MTNLILATIAALLWGTAYGAYFGPELRRWWRGRRRNVGAYRAVLPHPRGRPVRPRASPIALPVPLRPPSPPPAASNVIAFPRRPRR